MDCHTNWLGIIVNEHELPSEWHKDVLNFWFEELTPAQWYSSSVDLDESIRARFGSTLSALTMSIPENVYQDAHPALAAIIVFDQFPRNMFRGTAEAFGYDQKAIKLARHALDTGLDKSLNGSELAFMRMPFMHSELLADQRRSIEIFKATNNEKFAQDHYKVVVEFGRFPYRNEALDRHSTPAEIDYLKDAKRYGQ